MQKKIYNVIGDLEAKCQPAHVEATTKLDDQCLLVISRSKQFGFRGSTASESGAKWI